MGAPEPSSTPYAVPVSDAVIATRPEGAGPQSPLGVLAGVNSSAVTVRQERCARVRNRNATCHACVDACTSGCISMEDGRLVVDASKCVGCGTCATMCPTCALETHNPSDAQLVGMCLNARHGDEVLVVCHQVARALRGVLAEGAFVEVVCLGRVDESLVAHMASEGLMAMRLLRGSCAHCEQQKGLATAQAVCESANGLMRTWDCEMRAIVEDDVPEWALLPTSNCADARRAINGFFATQRSNEPVRASKGGRSHASASSDSCPQGNATALLHVGSDGTLPHFVPDRREALLNCLSQLGHPAPKAVVSTRLWGHVDIDPKKCTSCQMCAVFCPTGALARSKTTDGEFGVEHAPGNCVKCATCRDICPAQAITIHDDVTVGELMDGVSHRFPMRPRAVRINDAHQILNTYRRYLDGDVFER